MSRGAAEGESWVEGIDAALGHIGAICAGIVGASEKGEKELERRLRRRLFYAIHKATKRARYKGRILRVLGDSTLKSDMRLQRLRRSYAASKREGDDYSCLLAADSLAEYFVEWRFDARKASYWIRQARRLLRRFGDRDIRKSIQFLSKRIEQRSAEIRRKQKRSGEPVIAH